MVYRPWFINTALVHYGEVWFRPCGEMYLFQVGLVHYIYRTMNYLLIRLEIRFVHISLLLDELREVTIHLVCQRNTSPGSWSRGCLEGV